MSIEDSIKAAKAIRSASYPMWKTEMVEYEDPVDKIALEAMKALIINWDRAKAINFIDLASHAYGIADAMMQVKENRRLDAEFEATHKHEPAPES